MTEENQKEGISPGMRMMKSCERKAEGLPCVLCCVACSHSTLGYEMVSGRSGPSSQVFKTCNGTMDEQSRHLSERGRVVRIRGGELLEHIRGKDP